MFTEIIALVQVVNKTQLYGICNNFFLLMVRLRLVLPAICLTCCHAESLHLYKAVQQIYRQKKSCVQHSNAEPSYGAQELHTVLQGNACIGTWYQIARFLAFQHNRLVTKWLVLAALHLPTPQLVIKTVCIQLAGKLLKVVVDAIRTSLTRLAYTKVQEDD